MNLAGLSSGSSSSGMVSSAYSGLHGSAVVPSKDAFATLGATFGVPAPAPSLNILTDLSRLTVNHSSSLQQQPQQPKQPMPDYAFAMPSLQEQPPLAFAMPPNLSSIRVSDTSFGGREMTDDSESGFVMGGHVGAGLAPAPAVPPPPPPPGGW